MTVQARSALSRCTLSNHTDSLHRSRSRRRPAPRGTARVLAAMQYSFGRLHGPPCHKCKRQWRCSVGAILSVHVLTAVGAVVSGSKQNRPFPPSGTCCTAKAVRHVFGLAVNVCTRQSADKADLETGSRFRTAPRPPSHCIVFLNQL